jgi:hypothetical protein
MINAYATWSPCRRLLTGCVAGAAVALLVALMVLLGSSPASRLSAVRPSKAPPTPASNGQSAPSPSSVPATLRPLPPLPRTDDPVGYARAVAIALFAVNPKQVTRADFVQFWQGELPTVVYSDAAAKGLTLAAQNADVIDNLTSSWIPPQAGWDGEAADHTTNRFTITSVSVPDYWVNAVAEGTFRDPGLHLQRVLGVLSQSYGADPAHPYISSRSVVIDLGLLCGPTQPGGCRLVAPQQPPDLGSS